MPWRRLASFLRDLSRYASILEAKSIARRMFVTNSFDGLLSSLGVILGGYIAGINNPLAYFAAVGGASVAMGVFSGMIATYFSERAERLRELKETERAMLHRLRGSIYEKAAKIVPVYVALWSGVGATILPLVGATPFLVYHMLGCKYDIGFAVYSSVGVILAEIFALGYYLGRIAGENPLRNGLRLLAIGLSAAMLLTILNIVL
ncbi:MAG: VIT1/CCC1 transporter family protein [Pyrodictiaceae archaeon]